MTKPMRIWRNLIWRSTTGAMPCRRRQADYHRRRPTARQLDQVFWLEEERMVSADWVVRYKNKLLQLERQSRHWAPAKSRVRVRENEQGAIAIHLSRAVSALHRDPRRLRHSRAGEGALPLPPHPHPRALRVLIQEAQQPITLGEKAGSK